MKVIRVLEGERYTAAAGTGYQSATATEDGFEIDDRGAVFWITDAQLDEAVQARNRTIHEDEAATSTYLLSKDDPMPTSSIEELAARVEARVFPDALSVLEAVKKEASAEESAESARCPRCNRPGSKGPCSFDCETCHRCGKKIDKAGLRLFTTSNHVYCLDCGKHA